ncbi:MAG: hypothetical protein LBC73_01305 [Oscillospiraceae bacterium]|jgi:hypothetical protein|nr:hypothetical protein [Oscillospiraceae bacterium]
MKILIKRLIATLLVLSCVLTLGGCFIFSNYDPSMPISSIIGSPLVTGKWDGDHFHNDWTGFSFTLPSGFIVSDFEWYQRGEYALDFLLYHEDYPMFTISLSYNDVTQGARKEHTAEDYLRLSSKDLVESTDSDFLYTFNESLTSATIGFWDYDVMSGTFVNVHENPQVTYNSDRYAYRFVGTMVVFVAMYSDDAKHIVDDFFASIEQSWD